MPERGGGGGGRNKPLIEDFAAAVRMVWVCMCRQCNRTLLLWGPTKTPKKTSVYGSLQRPTEFFGLLYCLLFNIFDRILKQIKMYRPTEIFLVRS